MGVARGDVWLCRLDPVVGSEIAKTRPCLVISPPEIHDKMRTVIIAPMTTAFAPRPFRVPIEFAGRSGLVLLDHVRSIDKKRCLKRLGSAPDGALALALRTLQELFAE